MFFEMLVDKKNDEAKSDFIPKTIETFTSVANVCMKFFDNYQSLSSSFNSLVKTIVDSNHITPKNLKKKIVGVDDMLNFVNEIEEDRTEGDLMRDYPDKIEKLEEALNDYLSENDPKTSKEYEKVPKNGII